MKRYLAIAMALVFSLAPLMAADEVVVYSSRNEQLIDPIFKKFTEETGIEVRTRTDKAGALIQRIASEGRRTPGDILLTVDAGNLWQAKNRGLLATVNSDILDTAVPKHLRDPDNQWFGFSIRARTLVYNTDKVKPADLKSYTDLAEAKWKGKLLLRTSKKVYNQSLVAMLIAEHGEEKTEEIVKAWVANLGQPVYPNDTKVMEALAAGQGHVGVVNSYYFGRLKRKNPDLPLALFWPKGKDGGTHVNISGGAMLKHAKHPEAAKKLLEWLASDKAQEMFASANLEYPANPKVATDTFVASWGKFEQNKMNLAKAGELQATAIKLMDRAGYK